jgi:hypothetical protein
MRLLNILIILGCLVGGYWLVSSIMGPGIDAKPRGKPDGNPGSRANTGNKEVDPGAGARAHEHDWHLILDLPVNATRREIEAAYKRRLAKAEGTGDSFESIRIRRAYEAAMRFAKT